MTDLYDQDPPPFGDLTDDIKGAMIGEFHRGAKVEFWRGLYYGKDRWDLLETQPMWYVSDRYRLVKPQPRPMVVPWAALGPEWVWAMQDEDGRAYAYTMNNCPGFTDWVGDSRHHRIDGLVGFDPGTVDWKDSLVRRPE